MRKAIPQAKKFFAVLCEKAQSLKHISIAPFTFATATASLKRAGSPVFPCSTKRECRTRLPVPPCCWQRAAVARFTATRPILKQPRQTASRWPFAPEPKSATWSSFNFIPPRCT